MIKSIIIIILVILLLLMIVNCAIMAKELANEKKKQLDILEKEQREPISIEKFVIEPVELHVAFSADYSIYDKMDNDDIQTYIIERLATEFGNVIIENPDLYFVTDSDDLLRMMKHYDAKIRVIPFK